MKHMHTPGPWRTIALSDHLVVVDTHSGALATVLTDQNNGADVVAQSNARLIAAAPELYKTLDLITRYASEWRANRFGSAAKQRACPVSGLRPRAGGAHRVRRS